jgi:DNA-binding transcriptional MerR regulator
MLTVGEFSRASGLPVSALRYYDAAGVLRPAQVDPVTGYRWYTPDQTDRARLVARLRRSGLPVADICRAITSDAVTARRIVDAHQRHLEAELATATTHLDGARELLSAATRLTVDAGLLRAALRSVRYAVGNQPAWPALHGVLFDVDGAALRLVATDRHRLAVTGVPIASVDGPPVRVIVPVAVVDAFLDRTGAVRADVSLAAERVTLGDLDGTPIDALYPEYRALLDAHQPQERTTGPRDASSGTANVTMGASDLLAQVTRDESGTGPSGDLILIGPDRSGMPIADASRTIAFDREYLAAAARSFGDADLQLTIGERDALRLAAKHAPDTVALVMPIRLDPNAA